MEQSHLTPFVKWAGGKRQLLTAIRERMPESYGSYIEPFVGGGAVVFDLQPQNVLINDINRALINAYRQIRDVPEKIIAMVNTLDNKIIEGKNKYYYIQREYYNKKLENNEYDIELAALFIFINKHCFNGLYRVNKKGKFNVPYNNSIKKSVDEKLIKKLSLYLQNIEIMEGDFSVPCTKAKKGDFVFLDSPYAPLKEDTFESYTKDGFDKESHIRLAKVYKELDAKGCYCMLTNHNTKFINKLYQNYNIDILQVKRLINSKADNRKGEEVIVCNY